MAVAGFFATLVMLGFINFRTTRRNLVESEQIKDKNQQASCGCWMISPTWRMVT